MKTDELKTGDWVFYVNPVTSEKEIAKVVGVHYNDDYATVEPLSAKRLLVFDNEISGVPLTGEILGKNGWRKGAWAWEKLYLTLSPFVDEVNGFGVFVENGTDCVNILEIKYVHELQHLLWALSWIDDLEI